MAKLFSVSLILFALLFARIPSAAAGGAASEAAEDREICARVIAPLERTYEVPGELMQAVALTESGRWDAAKREKRAWPWTVTAGGKGEFFPTKAAAIAHVRKLQAQGRRNIDVGCMQINLLHHPRAFQDLDEAFDPEANAAYAAAFLNDLRMSTLSWMAAVSQYHSSTPALANAYWRRVNVAWNDARRRANEAMRLAQIEKFQAERAARGAATPVAPAAPLATTPAAAPGAIASPAAVPRAGFFPANPPPRLATFPARPQVGFIGQPG
jgi:hypothetical protein